MLRIAGQTAGPIGLTFFVDTHGCYRLKIIENIFLKFVLNIFFRGQRRASYNNYHRRNEEKNFCSFWEEFFMNLFVVLHLTITTLLQSC